MRKPTPPSGIFQEHVELWQGIRLVGSAGMMLVLTVVLAGGGGWLLDRYFHTGATGMAVCMTVAAVGALIWIARRVNAVLLAMSRHPKPRPRTGNEEAGSAKSGAEAGRGAFAAGDRDALDEEKAE